MSMYTQRLRTLTKAYRAVERENEAYNEAMQEHAKYQAQCNQMIQLNNALHLLSHLISKEEESWQAEVLRTLEAEILQDLSFVFPTDGYSVSLSARLVRGKIHIEAETKSYFTPEMAGDIADTQGRLFQQIVSFAALIGIMKILGVNTVYVDEAFSGVATENIGKVNSLLRSISERGFNLIIIAQNASMAAGLECNVLRLSRSIDNKTSITTEGGV